MLVTSIFFFSHSVFCLIQDKFCHHLLIRYLQILSIWTGFRILSLGKKLIVIEMIGFFYERLEPSWLVSMSDSWPGGCELDTLLRPTFFPYSCLSPQLKHVKKIVCGFGKKLVLVLVWEGQKMPVHHRHDMLLAVKVAINPNTINQWKVRKHCSLQLIMTGLIISQMTNVRLFQAGRVCRQQIKNKFHENSRKFPIGWKTQCEKEK